MMNYKQILEAINRGINLALDDYEEDINEPVSSKQDIIKVDNGLNEVIKRLEYKLENRCISPEELKKLAKFHKINHSQYKVKDNVCLRWLITYIVGSYQHGFIKGLDNKINLNWLDTSSVTDMGSLFKNLKYYGSISKWDTSNVTNMSEMFADSEIKSDISKWNVSKVKNMSGMFMACMFNSNIGDWDVSHVEDMSKMFYISAFDRDISKWNVSHVKYMNYMFYSAVYFQGDISKWNVHNVVNMNGMFQATKFNQPIGDWDVSNVMSSQNMFLNSEFNQDISKWQADKMSITTFDKSKISFENLPDCVKPIYAKKYGKK